MYFEVNVALDASDIFVLKNSNFHDRKFINKLLEMVFSKEELLEGSAKGNQSHQKSHKALNADKLLFIQRM